MTAGRATRPRGAALRRRRGRARRPVRGRKRTLPGPGQEDHPGEDHAARRGQRADRAAARRRAAAADRPAFQQDFVEKWTRGPSAPTTIVVEPLRELHRPGPADPGRRPVTPTARGRSRGGASRVPRTADPGAAAAACAFQDRALTRRRYAIGPACRAAAGRDRPRRGAACPRAARRRPPRPVAGWTAQRSTRSAASTRSPAGCAASAPGTASRTSARSSRTRSRRPTSSPTRRAAATTPSCVDELGDVLFQVYFLALLLEERGAGTWPRSPRA